MKTKMLEDAWDKLKNADSKNVFDFLVTAMEVMESFDTKGDRKAEMLLEIVDKVIEHPSLLNEDMKKELIHLKENAMITPYIDTICRASKQLLKINKKKLFDIKWCKCLPLK